MVDALAAMTRSAASWSPARCWNSGPLAKKCIAKRASISREKKIDVLIGVRGLAQAMVEGASEAGVQAEFVATPEEAGEWLARETRDGDVVLLKASRGVKLEKALETWKAKRESTYRAEHVRAQLILQELTARTLIDCIRRLIALLAVIREAVHYVAAIPHFPLLTFRTAFASLTALFTALIVGPLVIGRLREFQIGQYIREEGPKAHQKKAGTPTMGGLLIVIAIVVPTLLWADLSNRFVWIAVFSTCAFAAIGFTDDYTKVMHRRNLGLTGRAKLGLQIATSIVVAVAC